MALPNIRKPITRSVTIRMNMDFKLILGRSAGAAQERQRLRDDPRDAESISRVADDDLAGRREQRERDEEATHHASVVEAGLKAGDAFEAYPGCDHTLATCAAKFGNQLNYGGFPYIPVKNPFTGDAIV